MNLAECTSCQNMKEESDLIPMLSVLDWKPHLLCWRCFDHRCEPFFVIVRTAGLKRWNQVPAEIQQSVMVFDGLAGEYIDFETWCRRTAKRQVIPGMKPRRRRGRPIPHLKAIAPPDPVQEAEDDAILRVMNGMRRTSTRNDHPARPRAFWTLKPLEPEGRVRRFWQWICRQF